MSVEKKLLWDFFGPHASRTAEHFSVHLRQFLDANDMHQLPVQLESSGAGHQAVSCAPDESARPKLEAALRPNRVLPLANDPPADRPLADDPH